MANKEHLRILERGLNVWNKWREENPKIEPDLTDICLKDENLSNANFRLANLSRANLCYSDLSFANFHFADLTEAKIANANLRDANLSIATIRNADLRATNFSYANFVGATLEGSDLGGAILIGADLSDAYLVSTKLDDAVLCFARLVNTNLNKANLTGCLIFGISVWEVHLNEAQQRDLIITRPEEPVITVDNLEVAQFIHLLLDNKKIRDIINTITSKVVLILGRFTPERKAVLDTIRQELRLKNYLPVLFDFDKPASRSFIQTVSTLAYMARFIIADVTDAKVILQELQGIVPDLPSVPVQPILLKGSDPTVVLTDFYDYPWFLDIYQYKDLKDLTGCLRSRVIIPAETKALEIEIKRNRNENSFNSIKY